MSSHDEDASYYGRGRGDDAVEDAHQHNSDEEGEDLGYDHHMNDDDDDEDEEEEEEDEEEARKVAEGFIVDDEEEEDQDSDGSTKVAVRRKKKRRVEEYDEDLDEEDLDLLEENTGIKLSRSTGPKLKRLKRGREEPSRAVTTKGVEDIFSDEEEAPAARHEPSYDDREKDYAEYESHVRYRHRDTYDDIGDFIADEDEDDLDEVLGERRYGAGRDEGLAGDYYDEARGRRGKASKDMMDILPQGLSEDVLVDMFDIFGDGGDYEWALYDEEEMEARKEKEPQLADIFEPSELAERMLTEQDEEIRLRDVPERLQMRYKGLNKSFEPATDEQVEEEGAWVARLLASSKGWDQAPEKFVRSVTKVVRFFAQEFLEVPHIKDHRRDFFTQYEEKTGVTTEILTENDLWDIYDLDFKYQSFKERKTAFSEFLSKCHIDNDYVNDMIRKVEKVEEITDLMDYVNLKFSDNINLMQQQNKGPKRPMNKSLYELSMKTKVHGFLKAFGISASHFGANYLESNRRHFPEDSLIDPMEEAHRFVDDSFPDGTRVLKAAKSILAQEIAYDPLVRKAIRRDWETKAVVNVRPTEKGLTAIDELHPMHPFRYLYQKPLSAFKDGQFLMVLKGEADGLLSVSITMPDEDAWFNKVSEYYMSDGYSDAVQQWNDQRKEVLEQALKEYLVPLMDRYIREKLRIEAQDHVCKTASMTLYNKVNVGPFRGPGAERYKGNMPRVLAISQGNGLPKDPIMAVFVNQRGKVLDQIQVPNLKEERHWKDMLEFIKSRKPNVVGVAGYNAETRRLVKHMQTMLNEINQSGDMGGAAEIDMVIVDDEAARLYKNSKRAQEEFGEYPEVMRYCISLARRLQNPVLEYVGLGRDLLAIPYHELQHLVPEDMLFFYLERSLIRVVNDLGVDINAAVRSPYLANALQYVCGFGPRKAHSILKKIEAMDELESRTALVLRKLTPANTFINCASYLRIRDMDGADILDDTRIHPQDYELARKMAGDALEIDEDEMDDYDSKIAIVTRLIREYPDKVNDLILDDYANVLEQQYHAPKRQVLEHIKIELQGPYKDRRHRYVRPTIDEAFVFVTGETRQALAEGYIVPAQIMSLRGKIANCVLDSGIEGMIFVENASDDRIMNVGDVLQVGQTVNCKVLRIDREKFVVDLSCKASDTKPNSDLELRKVPDDKYYDYNQEARDKERQRANRRKQARNNRMIKHPLFRSFNHREAEEYLANRQRGDLVIRPSSRGLDHIAITWKVDEGVFQHVDVLELKSNGYNAPSRLKIGDLVFEDLDELIVTYIEAIARKVEELMSHPKYRVGGLDALQEYLASLTKANPKMSAYGFCMSEKAGYFDLAFKLSAHSPPMRWVVKVLPDGYRLRDTSYPTAGDLINGFKRLQASEARRRQRRR
ncbi:SH2 domain-containing protein [Radiomyces spectabilis]|uniref:SH2 domain-containing protein n=1 Tax=Radiomyces spectabilis TaxID=64574 RepID=UPI00221F8866|nr:SH2 domain-containing protein [Radiomyces spectabilis]KAI8366759.1 SH2 domain-containing protein [Radiomyces spectabilis]